jgi:hypothetical protein
MAVLSCLRFETQVAECEEEIILRETDIASAARTAMIPMTTSTSMRVKPRRGGEGRASPAMPCARHASGRISAGSPSSNRAWLEIGFMIGCGRAPA